VESLVAGCWRYGLLAATSLNFAEVVFLFDGRGLSVLVIVVRDHCCSSFMKICCYFVFRYPRM